MSKFWRPIALAFIVVFVGIQFVPVDRANSPAEGIVPAPVPVMDVLERSCFDCHSNQNRWPWYGYVAPFSWLIAHHMDEARDHLNFMAWNDYDEDERVELIEEAWDEIDLENMPPEYYLILHPSAELSPKDRDLLKNWAQNAE